MNHRSSQRATASQAGSSHHFLSVCVAEVEAVGYKQSNRWSAEEHIIVATHLSQFTKHHGDRRDTFVHEIFTTVTELLTAGLLPRLSRLTTSGHFVDTHGLARLGSSVVVGVATGFRFL